MRVEQATPNNVVRLTLAGKSQFAAFSRLKILSGGETILRPGRTVWAQGADAAPFLRTELQGQGGRLWHTVRSELGSLSEVGLTPSEEWFAIEGRLPRGYLITAPVRLHLWREGDEFVVEAPELEVHAFGATREEAIDNLRGRLVDRRNALAEASGRLGPGMKEIAERFSVLVAAVDA